MLKKLLMSMTLLSAGALALSANAATVEIVLADKLDGVTSEYCIDVKGGGRNIDITKGLQSHTCYSYKGALGKDQSFDTARFETNELLMSELAVCAELTSLEAGATVGLAECNAGDLQKLVFAGTGTISPAAAPEMCLTVGEETRFGRSKKHQIKSLTLEACTEESAKYQVWRTRETED